MNSSSSGSREGYAFAITRRPVGMVPGSVQVDLIGPHRTTVAKCSLPFPSVETAEGKPHIAFRSILMSVRRNPQAAWPLFYKAQRVFERLAHEEGLPVVHTEKPDTKSAEKFFRGQNYEGADTLRRTFHPQPHELTPDEAKLLRLFRKELMPARR